MNPLFGTMFFVFLSFVLISKYFIQQIISISSSLFSPNHPIPLSGKVRIVLLVHFKPLGLEKEDREKSFFSKKRITISLSERFSWSLNQTHVCNHQTQFRAADNNHAAKRNSALISPWYEDDDDL